MVLGVHYLNILFLIVRQLGCIVCMALWTLITVISFTTCIIGINLHWLSVIMFVHVVLIVFAAVMLYCWPVGRVFITRRITVWVQLNCVHAVICGVLTRSLIAVVFGAACMCLYVPLPLPVVVDRTRSRCGVTQVGGERPATRTRAVNSTMCVELSSAFILSTQW